MTMKIAKAEAAIKALTFLDVLGKFMKGFLFYNTVLIKIILQSLN